MKHSPVIGVDVMGSECPPSVLIDALRSLPPEISCTAIATREWVDTTLPFVEAEEVIELEESPLAAVRRKKNASLALGMRLLKEGKLDALISAGNTGALVALAKTTLGMIPGFLRPALLARLPTQKNPVCVLDLGANVQAKCAHFVQFAALGIAYQKVRGIAAPTVGILNIGTEPAKGTPELRAAYKKLEKGPFCFVGNIEGKNAFDGNVDVLITDGFTGNIFLKTAEGIANLILHRHPHLSDLHYTAYPGALLAGVQCPVIKCHGYSTPQALITSIRDTADLLHTNFKESFAKVLLAKEQSF